MHSRIRAFESLRFRPRPSAITSTARTIEAVHLQIIAQAEEGAVSVQTVDAKGRAVDVDHRSQVGPLRKTLRLIEEQIDTSEDIFEWDISPQSEQSISLIGKPELIDALIACDCLVDAKMQAIDANAEQCQLSLSVTSNTDEQTWSSNFKLQGTSTENIPSLTTPPDTHFLSSRHVLSANTLIPTQDTGGNPQEFPLFVDQIPESELETFLSLFASRMPNIPVALNGTLCAYHDPLEAKPVIAFKNVDEQGILHLELKDSVQSLDEAFIRDFHITTAARRVDATVEFREINYQASIQAHNRFIANLQKDARGKKKDPDHWVSFEEDNTIFLSKAAAEDFLSRDLPSLINDYKLIGAQKLSRYKVRYPKPRVSARLGSGIDFLEGDANLEIEDERFSILDAIRQYRKQGFITLSDGNKAIIDSQYIARLERLFKKGKNGVRPLF